MPEASDMIGLDFGKDEHGVKVPYVALELTQEEFREFRNKIPQWYTADGHQLFDVKDKEGNATTRKMVFLVFV